MSNAVRAVLALSGARLLSRLRPGWPAWAPLAPAAALWVPLPALASGAILWVTRRLRAARAARRRSADADADVVVLAELTALGLAGGLDPTSALRGAAARVAPSLRSEVLTVLRHARSIGLSAALAGGAGRAGRFYRLLATAVDTGAPVRAAVESFIDDAAHEQRSRSLAAARRLPVKLLFPLALMILPGFMLLTVGPALLSSLRRLGF